MFETSVVAHDLAPRRRYLLSVSLAAHSAAIVGAIAFSVASIEFPKDAPDQFAMLRPMASVAVRCGFGTAETLRQAFIDRYGIPPSRYRLTQAAG